MKLTPNIDTRELVPKSIWQRHGARSVRFLNAQLIQAQQWIIDRHGIEKTTFNDWLWGGSHEQRGLRVQGQSYYRGDGLHDHGNAIDSLPFISGKTRQEILLNIHLDAMKNPELYLEKGIWRIETLWLASTWLHIDSMFTPGQQGVVFIDLTERYSPTKYMRELRKRSLA